MSTVKHTKINNLLKIAPRNEVLTARWLHAQGYSNDLIKQYCRNGWLLPIARGAYLKVGDELAWEGALRALQHQLHIPVHPGGQTALAMHGVRHFLQFQEKGVCQFLFSPKPNTIIPKWFSKTFSDKPFVYVQQNIFNDITLGLMEIKVNQSQLTVSTPERAVLEMLSLVPAQVSYEHAWLLMEGLRMLLPDEMQLLLQNCSSIKAKRLFLYLAELHDLQCRPKLDIKKIDLGKGNRVIGSGGHYVAEYQLSVPQVKSDDSLADFNYV